MLPGGTDGQVGGGDARADVGSVSESVARDENAGRRGGREEGRKGLTNGDRRQEMHEMDMDRWKDRWKDWREGSTDRFASLAVA